MENFERLGQQARPGFEPGIFRLPVLERRTTYPLVGPRMGSLTSMPYPGFEHGTFVVAGGFPSHYTTWSEATFWEAYLRMTCYQIFENVPLKCKLVKKVYYHNLVVHGGDG